MLGILVQLIISWIVVYFFNKNNLSVLGFGVTKKRIADFGIFFLLTAVICASGFLLKMYFGEQRWQLNPKLNVALVWNGLWWNIKSVLFEELIFRGVLLYILIQLTGAKKAIIISAVAFGVYHWFSFGVIGNPVQMLYTFFITGAMGMVLAYGYAQTNSLYVPVGIHLGWNFTQLFIFSQGTIGNGVLVATDNLGFRTNSYLIFFLVTFVPLLLALLLNYLLIKKRTQQRLIQTSTAE